MNKAKIAERFYFVILPFPSIILPKFPTFLSLNLSSAILKNKLGLTEVLGIIQISDADGLGDWGSGLIRRRILPVSVRPRQDGHLPASNSRILHRSPAELEIHCIYREHKEPMQA